MRSFPTGFLLSVVVAYGVTTSPVFAQIGPPGGVGPPGPPPNGPQLYSENCSQCHGDAGDSVPNVDLMHGRFRRGTTDAELTGIVLRGIPGTDMPPHSFSEAQAAAIADDIAYDNHDVDDGLHAGLFTLDDLAEVPLAGPIIAGIRRQYPGLETARVIHETVRRMIGQMVEDVIAETGARIAASGQTPSGAGAPPAPLGAK